MLEQILKATQTTSAMKGADERELVLGRLLGVSSLALSGRLGSDPESAEGALKVGQGVKRRYARIKGGGGMVGKKLRRWWAHNLHVLGASGNSAAPLTAYLQCAAAVQQQYLCSV